MNFRAHIYALSIVPWACGVAWGQPADSIERHDKASLSCGLVSVTADTTSIIAPSIGVVWIEQTIRVEPRPPHEAVTLRLPHRRPPFIKAGRDALPAAVVSWACVKGSASDYVLLSYACGMQDLRSPCDGKREWFRILAQDGSRSDYGYRPQDARYSALYARLGIAGAMRAGVDLQAIIGAAAAR